MSKNVNDILMCHGYENVVIFDNPDYSEAFIGVTDDDRAVYDFDLMVKYLCDYHGMTPDRAVDFIDYNAARTLDTNEKYPVILYRLTEV